MLTNEAITVEFDTRESAWQALRALQASRVPITDIELTEPRAWSIERLAIVAAAAVGAGLGALLGAGGFAPVGATFDFPTGAFGGAMTGGLMATIVAGLLVSSAECAGQRLRQRPIAQFSPADRVVMRLESRANNCALVMKILRRYGAH
jgi:hypothetical protein